MKPRLPVGGAAISPDVSGAAAAAERGAPHASHSLEIDGLRALAVLAVIVNHLDKRLLPSGHLGVDVFFVISGYVITGSLAKRGERSFRALLAGFYVRRVKRLVPALAVSVLAGAVLISLFDRRPRASLGTGIASLFGVSNLYLYQEATDYFGSWAQLNVFTHTWSLGVEEQYYLVFPLVVWLTGLARRPRGLATFAASVGVASIASAALFLVLSVRNPPAAFYLMPARIWELGTGCLVYALLAREGRGAAGLRRLSPLALLLGIVAVLFVPAHFSAATTAAVVLLTGLLIVALRPGTAGYRVLASPGPVYVGQTSYSLYLWHWIVVALGHWTIGIHWWSAPFQLGLMFLLADRSYRYLERPLRSAEWAPSRGRTIAYGLAASTLAAGLVFVLKQPLYGRLYTGNLPRLAARGTDSLSDPYRAPDGRSEWKGAACVLSSDDQVGKPIGVEGCTLGDFDGAKHRVVVVGNSYSAAFLAAFDDLVTHRWAVTVTSSWGASPAPGIKNGGLWGKANDYYWATVVPGLVSRLRPGDWVLAISDLHQLSPTVRSPESENELRELGASLRGWSASLAGRGVRLAVLHGNPFAREADCEPDVAPRQWFAPFGGPCRYLSKEATLARRAPLDAMLRSLEAEGRITIVDLLGVFCPGDTCTLQASDGQVLYRDAYSHPSIEAARMSGPTIDRIFAGTPAGTPKDLGPPPPTARQSKVEATTGG
jgi:peptidoglycan/LPS O-acetylase OafA/YrhL